MSIGKRIAERQKRERNQLEVIEWGEDDAPLILYFGPLLAGEMDRIQRKHPGFLQSASFAGMIDLIILKAEDKEGQKVFSLEEKAILMREELTIIAKVAGALMDGSTIEDQEKN